MVPRNCLVLYAQCKPVTQVQAMNPFAPARASSEMILGQEPCSQCSHPHWCQDLQKEVTCDPPFGIATMMLKELNSLQESHARKGTRLKPSASQRRCSPPSSEHLIAEAGV